MLVSAGARAFAQDASAWTLSTADFHTEAVTFRGIDDKGVHVVPSAGGKEQVVPPEAFLQLDRSVTPVERPAKFMLHLLTGDRVGGEPVKVENDQLSWRNAAVGELAVPLTAVAALAKSGQVIDLAAQRNEDVVALSNGDTVRGIVTAMAGGQVQVKPSGGGEAVPVPLDSVVSIQFASAGSSATNLSPTGKESRAYRVRLDDGSTVLGSSLSVAGDKMNLSVGGGAPRPLPLARVIGIEQVNGPVSWLTSRTPSQDVQQPFVGGSEQSVWKTRTDADVAGQQLMVAGRLFKRGIGVHSYSRLAYPLDGTFKAFRTRYGINDSLVRADVTVRILVGGKVAHEKQNVKGGTLSPVVVVDLPADAKELVLEVDYGQGIDVEDRLNWLEPALLRQRPKPEPAPATVPATKPVATTKPATAPSTKPATAGGATTQ
jgi:hypothetical protein